ncbi:hypothetical protein LQ567_09210 [Niabella pedocola]|uniref:Capsule assembly Wzi family protein n=1 Tax=Niabella pedocola TaxID=1752077 RepID=A0ABS8PPA9_9BACT|nr:hypothetical protein [Niabella pedocola]MCD2422938.1 hypothetical protein [Niabella pedocola]
MQIKQLLKLALILLPFYSQAQTDNIELSDKQNRLINRLDIKLRGDSVLQFTTVKPYGRKRATERVERIDSLDKAGALEGILTRIDRYNIRSMMMNNSDWTTNYADSFHRKPILGAFFKNPAHLYAVDKRDQYSLIIDPVINFELGKATGTKTFVNTRGIRVRGQIDQRVGYYLYFSENQERDPLYVQDYNKAHVSVPGLGYYKAFKGDGFDYWDVRGGVTFHAGKYIDFQIAHDKFFIGDGYRTLFISDFSAPYPFLKLGVQAGKFQLTSVAAQTIAPFENFYFGMDSTRPRNYMMFHYLTWQATNWLKLGFFESTMYNSKKNGGLQVGYLNPSMFNRAYSSYTGNSAKSSIGLDVKANFAKHFQAYGQWLINEFVVSKAFKSGGPWVNKFGYQVGAKYADAFTIKNLDLQVEGNFVRPFTYTDKWAQNNFLHYNQPLAHPLGANFKEFVGIAHYQPLPRLYLKAMLVMYNKGLDTVNYNTAWYSPSYGGDLFRNYNDGREREEGYYIGSGISNKGMIGSMTVSYEILQNLFFDVTGMYRKYRIESVPDQTTKWLSVGLRWNMARRDFVF